MNREYASYQYSQQSWNNILERMDKFQLRWLKVFLYYEKIELNLDLKQGRE